MIQHYVRGGDDDNFGLLAKLYGISASDIADASGYNWSTDFIYDWLSTHGGTRQTPYAGHDSGYHWSLTPGMVLNIPAVSSKSPVIAGAVPAPFAGGPSVVIVSSPNGEMTVQPENGSNDVGPSPASPASPARTASAGGSFTNILLAGVAIGAVWYFLSGDSKPKPKHRTRAKSKSKAKSKAKRSTRTKRTRRSRR